MVMLGSVLDRGQRELAHAQSVDRHRMRRSPERRSTSCGSMTDLGVEAQLTGGETGGLLKSYNTTIPDALGRLDRLAEALITEVNRVHATGYGLQEPPQNGHQLLQRERCGHASDLDLTDTSGGAAAGSNPSLDNIAASSVAGVTGNNDIALADRRGLRPETDHECRRGDTARRAVALRRITIRA